MNLKPANTERLPIPNEGIMEIAPYKPGKSQSKPGVKVSKLSSNENPLGPSPLASKAFVESAGSLHRYPEGGAPRLCAAIGEVFGLKPEQIVCGAGSDELIGLLIHAYAKAGDDILISRHGFLMYKIYAQGRGVDTIFAPETDLRTDVDAMLAALTPRTKLVFVANPNNPTGSYISKTEMDRLHAGLPSDVLLVIDDAYAEYVEEPDYSTGSEMVESAHNVVMLRTFSKIYGLSALRLGWAYAPPHVVDVLHRVRGPFNVSTPAIEAGIAAVRDVKFVEKTRSFNNQWLAWMSKEIAQLGLIAHPSIANFVLVEFSGSEQAKAANDFLMERGLIVREVGAYNLPCHLRISIGLEGENKAVIAALKEFLSA
ncbi:MAG: histidinol-phosphate transaminase [Alphaproteobacteria bacterium]